jgi:hypothetical protein
MTGRPYKDYDKILCSMPSRPDVLKMVDALHGLIYINKDAADDANIVILIMGYSAGFCAC